MNLENFPTSESAQKMLRMVSNGFYDDSYVGKWIYQVIGAKLDVLQEELEDLPLQAYLDTATWGLMFWEQLVGLPVREDLDYEVRRALIKEKLDNRHPVSPAWLETYLSDLTGCKATVTENQRTYTFNVRLETGTDTVELGLAIKRLRIVKPAHMSYGITLCTEADQDIFYGCILTEAVNIEIGCEVPGQSGGLDTGTLDAIILG